jgi:hypothetical protein
MIDAVPGHVRTRDDSSPRRSPGRTVGVPFLGAGGAFIAVGLASARKATPPADKTGT